ncbi:hypothetical protein DV737_g1019, partial [Chaetothyriales sp. CBS 132003]
MANAPPSGSNLLTTQRALLDTLTSFLTVCTHHIIFLRGLYPTRSFLATRAYNYPVRQNRHPAVCAWINDAIAAIRSQLSKSTVEKVQLCIYETEHNHVLERWTFTLTIELRSHADRPVGRMDKHERAWIVAEPDSFSQPTRSSSASRDAAATFRPTGRPQDDGATTPVRRLEAGELRMEVWVEESPAKFAYVTPGHRTAEQRAKEMSYGEGTAGSSSAFDPEHGYEDVEGTDINRKPDPGRGAM